MIKILLYAMLAVYAGNNHLPGVNSTGDAQNVKFVGAWSFGSMCKAVTGYDTIVFMGAGGGIFVVNVSTPSNPVKINEMMTSGSVNDLAYQNGYLYAAIGSGMEVWNVSDLDSVYEVSNLQLSGEINSVFINGNYAYIAAKDTGVIIVDISDPSNPQEIGSYDTPGRTYDVFVDSSFCYVADGNGGVRVLSVADPTNPQEIGHINTPDSAKGIYISGNYAYVADDYYGGVRIIDISNSDSLSEVGHFYTTGRASRIVVSGNYAYVTVGSDGGLRVLDISDPTNPQRVGYYNTSGGAENLFIMGNYVYVADGNSGLKIIDVSTPTSPHKVGSVATPGSIHKVVVKDSIAYLASNSLRILNVSDPKNPREIGEYAGNFIGILVKGNYLYTWGGCCSYLSIFNISDPVNPRLIGRYSDYIITLDVAGNYAYYGGCCSYFGVLDLSNPSNPISVGHMDLPCGGTGAISVIDTLVLAGSGWGNCLQYVSVTNPVHPRYLFATHLNGDTAIVDILTDSIYAYVAGEDGGLQIVDINSHNVVGSYNTAGEVKAVYVNQNYAYVADGGDGLRVIDVSDPTHPQEIGYYDTPGYANDVFVSGKYIYVADEYAGLQIYSFCGDTLTVDSANGLPGSDINLSVRMSNREPISGIQATIVFDTTKLHFQNAFLDSSLNNFSITANRVGDSVKIVVVSITGDSILPGANSIFYLDFSIDSSVTFGDSSYIELTDGVLSDPRANQLDVQTFGGWVYFRGDKGDVNLDGVINITDAVREINIILRKPPAPTQYELWAADVNNDGSVNVADVVLTINIIIGRGKIESNPSGFADIWLDGNELKLRSNDKVSALQMDLLGDITEVSLNPRLSQMKMFVSNIKGGKRIVIVSLSGAYINPGETQILSFKAAGKVTLKNTVIANINGSELRPSNNEHFKLLYLGPNPSFSKDLSASIYVNQSGNIKVKIVNVSGRVAKSQEFKVNKGINNLDINIGDVTNGVYFGVFKFKGHKIIRKVLIER